MDNSPVFIAGCGRSGTTFLRTVLNNHHELFIPEETLFFVDYLKFNNYIPPRIKKFFLFKEPQLKHWYTGESFYYGSFEEMISKLHTYEVQKRTKHYWGQKTPRFIRYFEEFNKEVKNIKWILIYRDPRAVVNSMLKSKVHTYSIRKACRRWNLDNSIIINMIKENSVPKNVLIVKYENLIKDFYIEMSKVIDFIGLEKINIDDLITNAQVNKKFAGSNFTNNAVRGNLLPDVKKINDWRSNLSKKNIMDIESYCPYAFEVLGYSRDFNSVSFEKTAVREFDQKKIFDIGVFSKDIVILFRYLIYWPQYLFFSSFRMFVFRMIKLMRFKK